ncbi:MAG TPA: PIN domain-containing protein [Verrucomicrobiae bacterium]|nr:PIN domain-containing protein [Verrucomicrobiae bacterium]
MKYLFDTTTYSHLLKGHKVVANILKDAETIFMPNVVIAELRYGFRLGTKQEENERLLARFVANKKIRVILQDNATTDYFVNIAIFARKKGVQLSTHDIWIAALTEQWDATLVTFDNDFKHLDYKDIKLNLES